MRARHVGLILRVASSLALVACERGGVGEEAEDVPEGDRFGGTAVVAIGADMADMNPLTMTETNAQNISEFVLFVPVITYDEKLEPKPALARSWEVNADTSELTFHLRDDVFWHDGVKTTAYDLAYTYEMARNPETGFPNTAYWTYYGDGEAVDSFTFKVALRPHAQFMDPWRTFPAVPKHILGDTPAAQMRQHPFNSQNPVGNGPFKFVSREPGQSWTFEANPTHPAELGGRPYLDRVVFRVIPEPPTALTELSTGDVDFLVMPPYQQAEMIDSAPSTHIAAYPDRAFVLIGWNQRRPPFQDVRVRRALTMAIDRQQIVNAVLYGYGSLANATVPSFFKQFDPEAGADLTYNQQGALDLLAQAGYTRGPDGKLQNAAGQPLRFALSTNHGNQTRADIAAIVQAQLGQIGVDVQVQIIEFSTLLDRINNPQTRDFDAVLIGWRTEFRVDDTDLFHCEKMNEPFQWVSHCDKRLDALMDTLPLIVDPTASLPLWREYQKLIAEQQPYTFIYFSERIEGVSDRLRNVKPDARGDWVGIDKWWIAPDQRAR
jgi:peptide/nickel transport system substrate-binding protein